MSVVSDVGVRGKTVSETMKQLKERAKVWPMPYGEHARELIRDAHYDLARWPNYYLEINKDLRQALLATEVLMDAAESI